MARHSSAQIVLERWDWRRKHGFIVASGTVTNVSGARLANVLAVVDVYTDGRRDFIDSGEAILDLAALMPGQSSSFSVYVSDNPLAKVAGVRFREITGGPIRFRRR